MADSSGISRAMFLTWIETECRRSLKLVAALRAEDLGKSATPGAMTASVLVNHMIGSLYWLDRVAAHDDADNANFQKQYPAADGPGLAGHYESVLQSLVTGLRTLSDERFTRTVAVFGGQYELPGLILELMGHETHHRGQLALTLRAAGQVPPAAYS